MKIYMILALTCLTLGAIVGRVLAPKAITKTETITNTVTVTKTLKEPNGAVEIETTTTSQVDKVIVPVPNSTPPDAKTHSKYIVSATVGTNVLLQPTYGVQVQRQLLGPIYGGAYANTSGQAGLILSVAF